ncbi:hypothetical protein [Pseudovibrio sp. Tun.PSC04-5.I4]|uniref:hypothetical protein n=1 Tax=Pseudovibrio sp. Tun.PSC04-5.I4 TaxID=1798213 RepID=UPI000881D974|nr:hypothetical protein [Pseudovibrio sp. Tun.PSC04-5.I4]SDR49172.1 hypothetical protein SAMN04515695_6136 [Pseudovibrio sp. Tun.PSC04-5.I4]
MDSLFPHKLPHTRFIGKGNETDLTKTGTHNAHQRKSSDCVGIFLVVGSIGAYALLLNAMHKRHRLQEELVPPQILNNADKGKG